MKNFFRKAFRFAMPLFIGLTLSIICFFLIFRFDGIKIAFNSVINILKPFIYGAVIAYLLKTPFNWIKEKLSKQFGEKHKGLVNALSMILVLLAAVLIIVLLLVMVIPALVDSIVAIAEAIPGVMEKVDASISKYTASDPAVGKYIDEALNTLKVSGPEWLKTHVLPYLTGALGGVVGAFGSIIGLLYNLLIGIIVCIYLLLGKDTFTRQAKMLTYSVFKRDSAEAVLDEFRFIDKTFKGFFGGKILDSAIIGLICYVFCLIMQLTMGMHNAILISVLIGVTNIIPFFGPYIGAIPSALIILIDKPICCLIFIIFIILLQLFDGNVLGPMLLSESVGLTGFWVLFSITAFGGFFGIIGIIVGVPLFAVIYDLIRRWVYMMLKRHKINEYLPGESLTETTETQEVQETH
ncbi:MAG: AI-2E family transporter [Eubacterium sp.]|nr:AI-2E family transporter [Eubacterium sp.]